MMAAYVPKTFDETTSFFRAWLDATQSFASNFVEHVNSREIRKYIERKQKAIPNTAMMMPPIEGPIARARLLAVELRLMALVSQFHSPHLDANRRARLARIVMTGSGSHLGLVVALQLLPILFLGPWGGTWSTVSTLEKSFTDADIWRCDSAS